MKPLISARITVEETDSGFAKGFLETSGSRLTKHSTLLPESGGEFRLHHPCQRYLIIEDVGRLTVCSHRKLQVRQICVCHFSFDTCQI